MRNVAEEYVRFIAQTATPKAMTTREVEGQSHHDAELSEVRRSIREGVWSNKECAKYIPVKDELCAMGKVVLRGTRIVIPEWRKRLQNCLFRYLPCRRATPIENLVNIIQSQSILFRVAFLRKEEAFWPFLVRRDPGRGRELKRP